MKSKIWANEFVHLGALLQTAVQQERFTVGLSATGNGNKPQITLEPASAPHKLNSIQQWVTAFHTFMAIYCQKFAGDTAALLKYCQTVRAIANKNGNWAYYDEQFRYLHQSAPDRYPWEEVHWELWLEATSVTCLFVPREVTFPPGESENRDKSLSLKEHALTLITGVSVQGVPLPTSALDVEVSTQREIVQREGSNQPRALSLVEQQRLARLLESNPVTPIRIDRLT